MVLWWFVDQFLSCCLLDIKKSLFSLPKYTASAASQAFAAYKGEMWWWHWDGRRQLLRPEMGKVVEICWTWHGSEKRTCRIHRAMQFTSIYCIRNHPMKMQTSQAPMLLLYVTLLGCNRCSWTCSMECYQPMLFMENIQETSWYDESDWISIYNNHPLHSTVFQHVLTLPTD